MLEEVQERCSKPIVPPFASHLGAMWNFFILQASTHTPACDRMGHYTRSLSVLACKADITACLLVD